MALNVGQEGSKPFCLSEIEVIPYERRDLEKSETIRHDVKPLTIPSSQWLTWTWTSVST